MVQRHGQIWEVTPRDGPFDANNRVDAQLPVVPLAVQPVLSSDVAEAPVDPSHSKPTRA